MAWLNCQILKIQDLNIQDLGCQILETQDLKIWLAKY